MLLQASVALTGGGCLRGGRPLRAEKGLGFSICVLRGYSTYSLNKLATVAMLATTRLSSVGQTATGAECVPWGGVVMFVAMATMVACLLCTCVVIPHLQ